ncbi:MAG: hypothetical protein GY941_14920 [Planctomycetes bacterium]|nr:hypothetical protein [Planctomycetota bacterium]
MKSLVNSKLLIKICIMMVVIALMATQDNLTQAATKRESANDILPIGGRTIGGPARFGLSSQVGRGIFRSSRAASQTICLTVANIGPASNIKVKVNLQQVGDIVGVGEILTVCMDVPGFGLVHVENLDVSSITDVVWRIDTP